MLIRGSAAGKWAMTDKHPDLTVLGLRQTHVAGLSSGHMRMSSIPGLPCESMVPGKKSNSTHLCSQA